MKPDFDPLTLVRPNILALAPYSTARDEYDGPLGVYLDANESPYENGYNRYPDPHQRAMKAKISKIKNVPESSVFLGNGSDEAIDLALRVFCRPGIDNAVSIAPTYGMYRVAAATNDVEFREVPLGEGFSLDVGALLSAADSRTRLLFICSPNNPTGNSFPAWELEYLLDNFDGMVVLDEAYIDFCPGQSLLPALQRWKNLIILQTLSKAWGMAGLRLGMAFAAPEVIALFSRVKYPYNINAITQETVLKGLEADIRPQVSQILSERERIGRSLQMMPLVERLWPSDANFILARFADPVRVYNELIAQGIIVRDRSRIPGCQGCLRITIGTPAENEKLLATLAQIDKQP